MKTEKKLIACSIIAVIIGISSVFPLAFLMSASATADTTDEPWFSIDMTFAYWVTSDCSPNQDFNTPFPSGFDMNETYEPANITMYTSNGTFVLPINRNDSSSNVVISELNETNYVNYQRKLGLNTTLNVDTTNEACDGRVEYYKIEVSSDQGLIQTLRYFVGTNSNSSFSITNIVDGMHFSGEDWFDTDEFVSGGGSIGSNWTTGYSEHSFLGGAGEAPLGENSIALIVAQLREAQTITITMYRVGWATFRGDSITFTSANNTVVDQIQLEKYGDGWLYNDLYPEDELAEKDLLHPVMPNEEATH